MSSCGCKGVRTCLICEKQDKVKRSKVQGEINIHGKSLDNKDAWMSSWKFKRPNMEIFDFCVLCSKVYPAEKDSRSAALQQSQNSLSTLQIGDYVNIYPSHNCDINVPVRMDNPECFHSNQALPFKGVEVVQDFIDPLEEKALLKAIENSPFIASQSGRLKQDFGPQVNFKKRKVKYGKFTGLPSYSRLLYERMKKVLDNFEPVEMCNLDYSSERGSHIDPHIDDQWIWGERLVTVNLLSDSILTFCNTEVPGIFVRVPLPRRGLVLVKDDARHKWKHLVDPRDIHGRRMAMTFRELTPEFMPGGERADEGAKLLEVALSFSGVPVGTATHSPVSPQTPHSDSAIGSKS